MMRLIMAIATGCYVGYLPKMPGTYGSVWGLPIAYGLTALSPTAAGIILLALVLIAIWSAGAAEKILDSRDPSIVVIDEVVGMLVALVGHPPTLVAYGLGFLLFRFFDILKPFPIRFIDQRIQGGIGIVFDDLLAGVMANLSLRLIFWLTGML